MKAKDLWKICNAISNYIKFRDDESLWDYVKEHKIGKKEYSDKNFKRDLKLFKEFISKPFDLYNRKFLGIKRYESVCAIAVPLSQEVGYTKELIESSKFKDWF